jgi:quinol monooxygenase YgiN
MGQARIGSNFSDSDAPLVEEERDGDGIDPVSSGRLRLLASSLRRRDQTGHGLGVLSSQVWRSQDDRNVVVILETYDSRESVEALMSSPEIQAEMVADGVDPASVQLDILDAAPPTS